MIKFINLIYRIFICYSFFFFADVEYRIESHSVFQAPLSSAVDDMASLEPAPFVPVETAIDSNTSMEPTPFVPVETAIEAAEMIPQSSPSITYTEMKSPVQSSNPIAIPERADVAHDQDFDAFSSRFESVGKEDSLMVEADPFDPFSAGGSAKGTSGNIQNFYI